MITNFDGLQCDFCDWKDQKIEDFENYINHLCPKCNHNILTPHDFHLSLSSPSPVIFNIFNNIFNRYLKNISQKDNLNTKLDKNLYLTEPTIYDIIFYKTIQLVFFTIEEQLIYDPNFKYHDKIITYQDGFIIISLWNFFYQFKFIINNELITLNHKEILYDWKGNNNEKFIFSDVI